ncbi:class I SAM-dependent methyltransferase [Mycobacteroides franklinii]|uniref:class I SAM-dependent methyltransferase n=2 Tax=Mycobacteriaceae TaxID=1762 RepID=UPI001957808D|nr:class I SAM-dependent methyltransferase [Mycobacteroides franklinii]
MSSFVAFDSTNAGQAHSWDGDNGDFWSKRAERFDQGMSNFHPELLRAAEIYEGSTILDIGCGAGQVTRDAARIAQRGSVLGLDLSSSLLQVARRLAVEEQVHNASFVQADAQVYEFADLRFDVALSRHGTMFFGDPHAAFVNIARALRPGGRLVQLVWQPLECNEGISTFRRISAGGRQLPPATSQGPNPFSLSNPDYVHRLLRGAGLDNIEMVEVSGPMYYGRDVDDAFDFVAAHNASAFAELDAETRGQAVEALRGSITEHLTDHGVFYDSAHWLIKAERCRDS